MKGLIFLASLTPGSRNGCDDGPACPQMFLCGHQFVVQGYQLAESDRRRLGLSPTAPALRLPTDLLYRGLIAAAEQTTTPIDEPLLMEPKERESAVLEHGADTSVIQGDELPAELAALLTIPTGETAVVVTMAALQGVLVPAGRS